MKKNNLFLVLPLIFVWTYVDASTRNDYEGVLNQTDETGTIAIIGKKCKNHFSSCNGVTVKNLKTGEVIFKDDKFTYDLDGYRKPYKPNEGRYYNYVMAPNGERFGFWIQNWYNDNNNFYIYQTNPLKVIKKIGGEDWDERAEFSESGKLIVLVGGNDHIGIFDVESGKRFKLEIKGLPKGGIQSIGISPDDAKVISVFEYGIVAWDLETGKQLYNHNKYKRTGLVSSGRNYYGGGQLRFSSDSRTVLSVGLGRITLFDINTGNLIKSIDTERLSDNSHYTKVDFVEQGNLPLITVLSPIEFLKNDKYEIFIADWQKEQRLTKIGKTGDNYHQVRKQAARLTSSEYTEHLLEETKKAKKLKGLAKLTKIAELYQQNDTKLSSYLPDRKLWIAQLKLDWYSIAKNQIILAKSINNEQDLKALIKGGVLGSRDNILLAWESLHIVLKNKNDYKGLAELSQQSNIPIRIKEQSLLDAISLYPDSTRLSVYLELAKKSNNPNVQRAAHSKIYQRVKVADNIASYQWYLKNIPQSEYTQEALVTLYKRAFELAKNRDTIASYNDFIIAYPLAPQVTEATDRARKLEEDEYSSFFSSDEELSRRLLIRSKQISRSANQYGYDNTGYLLVVNRMNTLLQDMYPAEDATLRHLESEEFKDFHRDFSRAMRSISSKLDKINANVSDLKQHVSNQSDMIEQHFKKAAQDREMASELTRQHRLWERYMQGTI